MMSKDQQIADILARYEEPVAGNIWRVSGTPVILHKTLERIATYAHIEFDPPTIIRAERDEAVILVTGRLPDEKTGQTLRTEWSLGEAVINVNYKVTGKQAAYVWAMAEKRAKDRVILKLLELHGMLYSEAEADDFRQQNGAAGATRRNEYDERGGSIPAQDNTPVEESEEEAADREAIVAELKVGIHGGETTNAVTDYMLSPDAQALLAKLSPGVRDEVRDFAKARLVSLGWGGGKTKPGRKAA